MSMLAFGEYLAGEIAKHEQLLEDAYDSSDTHRIENNALVIEKLREVKYEFDRSFE